MCNYRFENFSRAPLTSFKAFDYLLFPDDLPSLAKHGLSDVKEILKQMPQLFPEESHSVILDHYNALKPHLRQFKKSKIPKTEVLSNLLAVGPEKFSAVLRVVEVMLVISPSTATCERGFSAMNLAKTNLRAQMDQTTLQSLLTIMLAEVSLKEFDPCPSIDNWFGTGGKHIHGHKTPPPRQRKRKHDERQPTSVSESSESDSHSLPADKSQSPPADKSQSPPVNNPQGVAVMDLSESEIDNGTEE